MIDYYEILGVAPDATEEEIRKAYRARAVRWHPDKWAAEPEADRKAARIRFEQVQQAYEHLKDPKKREAFDKARGGDAAADRRVASVPAAEALTETRSYAAEVARELREAIENAASATTPERRRYWRTKAQSWERTLDPILSMIRSPDAPQPAVVRTIGRPVRSARARRRHRRTTLNIALLVALAFAVTVLVAIWGLRPPAD